MRTTILLVSVSLVMTFGGPVSAGPAPPHDHTFGAAMSGDGAAVRPVSLTRADYVLLGVDCFGPLGTVSCESLTRQLGVKIGGALPYGWSGGGGLERIRGLGPWEHVTLSPVFYPDGSAWLAIDVRNTSAPTRAAPTGLVEASSNLLSIYQSFYGLYLELSRQGVPVVPDASEGTWQYGHGSLTPYVQLFHSAVPSHRTALAQVLVSDARPSHRRAAAGLLAFDLSAPATLDALSLALMDPDPTVRTGAANALLPKVRQAASRGESILDVELVVSMLMLPSHSDRTGASALLTEMLRLPGARRTMVETAAPILRQMASGSHPSMRTFARNLLAF